VIAHREKDQFAGGRDNEEQNPGIEVGSTLEEIFPELPNPGTGVKMGLPPCELHGSDRFADPPPIRLGQGFDLAQQAVSDPDFPRDLRCLR
jgi:hypothetical protein